MSPRGPGARGTRLAHRFLSPLADARDREEILADLEALAGKDGRGRMWYWRELLRLGFNVQGLALADVDLTHRDDDAPADLATFEAIRAEVGSLPGVSTAAWAWASPFSGRRMANDILWEAGNSAEGRGRTNVDMNVVDPSYFQTLGIPLLAGREFTTEDRAGATGVAVINEALASRLWPGEPPLGKRIWDWRTEGPDVPLMVVGVVENGRYYRSWRTGDRPFVFLPLAQNPRRTLSLHVRTAAPQPLEEDLPRIIGEADPGIPVPRVRMAEQAMAASMAIQRTTARILMLFGALATFVAMIGVYGVVAFTVGQRTHEIGVRMALGARPADVQRMVMAGSAKPILVGSGIGLGAAAVLSGFLAPMLFGVGPRDPITYATVAAAVLVIGLLAAHLPARRATRVDPLTVLGE